jgi:tRNA pseudouridine(55) synthase
MYIIDKTIGETPLEALERVRTAEGIPSSVPMTYAGRLDPLAEGLLIILAGEECKEKEKYLGFDKIYEADIILGVNTDTYDVMGLPKKVPVQPVELAPYVGIFMQEYPPYSSKPFNGTPLFTLARERNLPEEMPQKEVEIYSLEKMREETVSAEKLLSEIERRIGLVHGNFRQEEIIKEWRKLLSSPADYTLIKIRAHVSSGVYIRSLAHKLGGTALGIKRVQIGEFIQMPRPAIPRAPLP